MWEQIIGAGIGGLAGLFGGSGAAKPTIVNKDLGPEHGYLLDFYTQIGQSKNQGNKYYNSILKGLMKGDTSLIGNPFAGMAGAQKREIDANIDPFLPPELARRQADIGKQKADEQMGQNFVDYVSGAAANAAAGSQRGQQFKQGLMADILGQMARNRLDSQQVLSPRDMTPEGQKNRWSEALAGGYKGWGDKDEG